jgi:feruloyl esterase
VKFIEHAEPAARRWFYRAAALFCIAALPSAAMAKGADCATLARTAFPSASSVLAREVGAGSFVAPGGKIPFAAPAMFPSGASALASNPAFCRITATLKPTADSAIKVEVWLPAQGWNGKFLAVGSFGWGGSIMYGGLLDGIAHGYAVANTDTGHEAGPGIGGGSFALGHPEKLIDYAWRADHEMTLFAKAVIKARYGAGPRHSYWIGCSLGGLEGLIEAERFPDDYDGIVAGAPPNPLTGFNALQIWASWLVNQEPARQMSEAQLKLIHDTVVAQCGGTVGKQQNFVEEPDRCGFDPVQLQCKEGSGAACLTPQQVFLMQRLYEGPKNSRTGKLIYPGPAKGSELTLSMFMGPQPMSVAFDLFRYVAFDNPDFTLADMDFGKTYEAAEAKVGPLMHVGSNLGPFFKRGGKLLLYVGWNDFHNPTELISYYQRLARDGGPLAGPNSRIFTIPGMNHCMGGEGCDTFDKLAAIDQWVAAKKAPEQLVSAKFDKQGRRERTRPICAWPKVTRYRGTGSMDEASSFMCTADDRTQQ